MDKRSVLAAATALGVLPVSTPAFAGSEKPGPVLLTIGGSIGKGNRGPLDPSLDQLMLRHGVAFSKALALDAQTLRGLPAVSIEPTLEYDSKPHKLTGPLLISVLGQAHVDLKSDVRIGLRAIDGYNVNVSLDEIRSYRMIVATHMDGKPLALGNLGPQWAVYEPRSIPAFKDKPLKERFALCPWGLYYVDVAPA
jgi:hypothetical protein